MSDKTIVIGIDGATFQVMDDLLASGRLPNIKRIINDGVHGDLRSTLPPSTVPAWPAFYTGKSPRKMGIHGFATLKPKSYEFEIVDSDRPESPGIWDYLGEDGRRSLVFNIPTTYPPEKIDGVLVSGLMTPTDATDWARPYDIQSELEDLDYQISVDEFYDEDHPERYVEHCHNLLDRRTTAVRHTMQSEDWDFTFVLLRPTDLLSHPFLGEYVNDGPNSDVVPAVYEAVDDAIGKLLDGHEDNVILMSDHGFDHCQEVFQVNNFLNKAGYLDISDSDLGASAHVELLSSLRRSATDVISKLGLKDRARTVVPELILDIAPRETDGESLSAGLDQDAINWDKTVAFCQAQAKVGKVYLNTSDRPNGWITPDEYEDTRTKVLNALQVAVADYELDIDVCRGEEVYGDSDRTPDVILVVNQRGINVGSRLSGDVLEPRGTDTTPGIHDHHGIFAAAGPAFEPSIDKVTDLRIWDIVPTLLHATGSPVPEDMDGEVRRDILSGNNEVEFREPITSSTESKNRTSEGVKERLEGLGYLS